jgi:hypothetical protein
VSELGADGDRRDAPPPTSRRRHAALLAAGAGFLLYRTIALLRGARTILRPWVIALTCVEMVLDAATVAGALRWRRSRSPHHAHLPLRTGAAATLLHAVRVLVFVLGRTGPRVDIDVRPEARADHDRRWTWTQVVVAGVLSVVGVIGTGLIWRWRALGDLSSTERQQLGQQPGAGSQTGDLGEDSLRASGRNPIPRPGILAKTQRIDETVAGGPPLGASHAGDLPVGVVAVDAGHDRLTVDETEVGAVGPVLGHLLQRRGHHELAEPRWWPNGNSGRTAPGTTSSGHATWNQPKGTGRSVTASIVVMWT